MRTILGAAALFVLTVSPTLTIAAIIIVPDDFPTVQAAVDAAMPGDTVQVRPGVYVEAVLIPEEKTNLTLEGLGGRPTLAPATSADVVRIDEADGVIFRGFEVQGGRIGVRIDDAISATVSDVVISGTSRDGVRVKKGSVTVDSSNITGATGGRCIRVERAPGSQVNGNIVSGCSNEGIRVKSSDGTALSGNDSDGNGADGILIQSSDLTTVTQNGALGNSGRGIRVKASPGSTVDDNEADGNLRSGIFVERSESTAVTNNDADNNSEYGIQVKKSPPIATVADLMAAGNTATGNAIADFLVVP